MEEMLYMLVYPAIERTCVANGWGSAVHGSVVTDFDLMLQPYTDKAIQILKMNIGYILIVMVYMV